MLASSMNVPRIQDPGSPITGVTESSNHPSCPIGPQYPEIAQVGAEVRRQVPRLPRTHPGKQDSRSALTQSREGQISWNPDRHESWSPPVEGSTAQRVVGLGFLDPRNPDPRNLGHSCGPFLTQDSRRARAQKNTSEIHWMPYLVTH